MRSKENIEHEVTDGTFCDCKVKWSVSLAEFLSFLENITVEKTEDIKRIDIDRTDPCSKIKFWVRMVEVFI